MPPPRPDKDKKRAFPFRERPAGACIREGECAQSFTYIYTAHARGALWRGKKGHREWRRCCWWRCASDRELVLPMVCGKIWVAVGKSGGVFSLLFDFGHGWRNGELVCNYEQGYVARIHSYLLFFLLLSCCVKSLQVFVSDCVLMILDY